MNNIAILASGSGTNAENIINYFKNSETIQIKLVLSNKKDAFVHERAKKLNIPSFSFNRKSFYESDDVLNLLKENEVNYIVLAGFLWFVPQNLLDYYQENMINIHPALLPKYGGKGMYGMNVHQAVYENKEKETGITIHHVNEEYDKGNVIFQAKCSVDENDTPESIAQKVHALEYEHFPRIIEELLEKR